QQAARNGLDGVRFEPVALGASPGTATLHLSDVTDSSNSLLEGFRPSQRGLDVPIETLDDYVAAAPAPPRLLKIDTEATEPDVLRGAERFLRDQRPWLICEVLAGRTEAELEALLAPLGYQWHQITAE